MLKNFEILAACVYLIVFRSQKAGFITIPLDLDVDSRKKVGKTIKFAHELDEIMKTDPRLVQSLSFGVYKRTP